MVGGARGSHTEDRVELAAHAELCANNVGIAAKSVTPEFVVENDHVFVAGLRVFADEMAAEDDVFSKEEVKESRGYPAGPDLLGPIGCRDGEAIAGPCVERVEDFALLLPVEVVAR